jgi:AcrR family transcriptional regulator
VEGDPPSSKRARPGGHRLRREVLEHHQRERILAGAAKAISERGYRQASVADIVKSAAIARARFYENFSSKEDCFFALYDETAAAAVGVVSEACTGSEAEFPDRVRIGLEALLSHLAADPALARAFIVEGPAVGPPITSRFEDLIAAFATLLRAGRPSSSAAELPETVEETVVGGLYWLLYYALLDRQPRRIEKLLPQLTEFALIPFIGAEEARSAASAG